MNAITYFKLNSPYDGDVTKNCALTGSEVDNNFYTLEGRDIKSVELNNGKIVINLMNGDRLTTDNITENCIKDISIAFDEVNGILTITKDGVVQTIDGFATNYNIGDAISVDGSLVGNGKVQKPVGISPIAKTGQYKPVKSIIDMTNGEKLPSKYFACPGDRFLTIENVNEFGYLYNYEGLKKIACRLKETGSQWRVPTKQDWDDMLNAIEPCEDYRNHGDARSNKSLGKFAGKFLKSKEYWKKNEEHSCEDCHDGDENTCFDYADANCSEECACGRHTRCHPDYCGEYGTCHHRHKKNTNGIDKFCFTALPAGYSNEARDFMYFKERAYFWTASNHECRDAYVKILTYDKNKVLQDVMASDNFMSVRLVKDYNGDNFNEREDILGNPYSTVLMPSMQHGQAIWTSINIAFADCGCNCSCRYLLPNDGQGLVYSKRYFINEWTGKDWLKKEVEDGESVVVINEVTLTPQEQNDSQCHCNHEDNTITINPIYKEYRVVNGELVDVAKLTYDDVMEYVQPKFNEIEGSIEDLEERLNAEIERSTTKDDEIENRIIEIKETVDAIELSVDATTQAIEDLNAHLEQTDANLTQEIADREAKDTELENAIQSEEEARIAKDDELTAKDTELENAIEELETKQEELDGKTLTQDGTTFDNESGVLTLKSKDGSNDIEVQFNFNFGTF